jgi:hypothetical protein
MGHINTKEIARFIIGLTIVGVLLLSSIIVVIIHFILKLW